MRNENIVFFKGIENLKAIGFASQWSRITSFKLFAFYALLCAVAKEQCIDDYVFFINGNAEKKRKSPTFEKCFQQIYLRKFFDEISELNSKKTIISVIPRLDRWRIILKAIISVPKGRGILGRWLEFNILRYVIFKYNIKEVCSYGHYDEFTYWLANLCKSKRIRYTMYQHGIVMGDVNIPNKVYCDNVHVYNNYSKMIFQRKIVENENCVFCVDGFKSSISFKHLEKNEKKRYIGVVDQNDSRWLNYVTKSVSTLDGVAIVVMLHPLTKNISIKKDNILVTRDKYDNVDYLISDFSTLILDYLSIEYSGIIMSTNKMICEDVLREYDICYVDIMNLKIVLRNMMGNGE